MSAIAQLASSYFWYAAVALFGAGVGASELIARYKDAPFRALHTVAAVWYIFVNGLASLLAYILIVEFDWSFGVDAVQKPWIQAMIAGFSSMVFFRSSLFTMKIGDTDVSVGPGIFFQVLLFATDRECDRARAGPRSTLVSSIMQGVSFDQARDALPSFCFELMQNVPASEQQRFRQVVDALTSSRMRDSVKILNLGLMLMNVVGSQVLRAAVQSLGQKIQGPAKLEIDVFTQLQTASFDKAFPVLVDICFIMSRFGTDAEQAQAKKKVLAEVEPLKQRDLDNGTKMTILGLSLQQQVGDAVLLAALAHVADGIQLKPASTSPADAPAPEKPADTEAAEPTGPSEQEASGSKADVVPLHADSGDSAVRR